MAQDQLLPRWRKLHVPVCKDREVLVVALDTASHELTCTRSNEPGQLGSVYE